MIIIIIINIIMINIIGMSECRCSVCYRSGRTRTSANPKLNRTEAHQRHSNEMQHLPENKNNCKISRKEDQKKEIKQRNKAENRREEDKKQLNRLVASQ